MKNITLLLICCISCSMAYSQDVPIQYNKETQKAYFQKEIKFSKLEQWELNSRITKWINANYKMGEYTFPSPTKYTEKIRSTAPKAIKLSNKDCSMSYELSLEFTNEKCTIIIFNMVNIDAVLDAGVEWYAFKDDGSRRTNPARIEATKSIEDSMNKIINSLEKALNNR